MLEEVIGFADSTYGRLYVDSLPFDLRHTSSSTTISIDNFYQYSSDTLNDINHQTVASFSRRQEILGVGFVFGGSAFLFDGEVDFERSGITFAFDRTDYLDQLRSELDYDPVRQELDRLSQLDPQLLLARYSAYFDDYLAFTRTPEYRTLYEEATQVADSLRGYVADEFDARSRRLIEIKGKLDELGQYRNSITPYVQQASHEVRTRARQIIDSSRQVIQNFEDQLLLRKARALERFSGFERILLATKNFSIGNTRLPVDGETSIGLPIRGINYTYERGGLAATIVYGSRIISRRFTPREGIAFHDLHKDMKLGQFTLNYAGARSQYSLAVLSGEEQQGLGQGQLGQTSAPTVPLKNRVITFRGETAVAKHATLVTSVSHATTATGTLRTPSTDDKEFSETNKMSLRAGFALDSKHLTTSLTAFRTGAAFRTFANPYLYTDYQGIEMTLAGTALGGVVNANLSFAGGFGTTAATKENFRIRAQGQLDIRLSKANSLLLIAAPNMYRYTVTGEEGFTSSSVYNLLYRLQTKAFGQPAYLHLGGTNLNQGVTWADTTTVINNLVGTVAGVLAFTPKTSLSLDGQYQFNRSAESATGPQYNAGIKMTYGAKAQVGLGINYGIFTTEVSPAFGATLDVFLPLTKWASLRFDIFYRPTNYQQEDPTTIPQLYSQQSWQTIF